MARSEKEISSIDQEMQTWVHLRQLEVNTKPAFVIILVSMRWVDRDNLDQWIESSLSPSDTDNKNFTALYFLFWK